MHRLPHYLLTTCLGEAALRGGFALSSLSNESQEQAAEFEPQLRATSLIPRCAFPNHLSQITRESVLDALKKRHVYASTDEILADVEGGAHMMGDEFSTADVPTLKIKLSGTSNFKTVSIVRDGKYVYLTSPNSQDVELSWRDNQPNKDQTSYYYVRGEQDNGEIVWISPMWIRYTGK